MAAGRFWAAVVAGVLPVSGFGRQGFLFSLSYIWVRGTLPRFRYDQLMSFGWKFLLPLAIANLVIGDWRGLHVNCLSKGLRSY